LGKLLDVIKKCFDIIVGLFLVLIGVIFLQLYYKCFIKDNWLNALFALIIMGGLGILAIVFGSRRLFLTIKSIFKKVKEKREGSI
jgi:hypothetical protein